MNVSHWTETWLSADAFLATNHWPLSVPGKITAPGCPWPRVFEACFLDRSIFLHLISAKVSESSPVPVHTQEFVPDGQSQIPMAICHTTARFHPRLSPGVTHAVIRKHRDSMAPAYGNQVPAPLTLLPTATLLASEDAKHLLIHLFLRLEIPENPQSVIMHGSQETQVKFENGSKFESESHSVVSSSLRPCGSYSPWTSLGQNIGLGILSLLQGIFPNQGWNPRLLHYRRILYQLSHNLTIKAPRLIHLIVVKQILHISAYIWNLERWCWWIYFQGSSGNADAENRLVVTAGKRKSRT